MKRWLQLTGDLLLMILILPQVFVFVYYAPLLIKYGNRPQLALHLFGLGLAISRVSTPFFLFLAFLLNRLRLWNSRWFVFLPFCVIAVFLCLLLWNWIVFETFSCLRALLPTLVCGTLAGGYTLFRMHDITID